jgi:chemotaxis protein methyltransferase CheR
MSDQDDIRFLQWALPKMGYRWSGFRKPRNQVIKRIKNRIQELDIHGGYPEYKSYLAKHPEEWKYFEQICFVTISKFFRDRKLWEFLRDEIISDLIKSPKINRLDIWSAGCCNGEEPYTIAIILDQLSKLTKQVIQFEILATDLDSEVLDRAKKGSYPPGALKEVTESELETYFIKCRSNKSSDYLIDKKLANSIEFEIRDIKKSIPGRKFHLIFCRNLVFTYFSANLQQDFLQRLKSHLMPGAYLVTGSNETLPDTPWLTQAKSTFPIYRFTP